MAKVIYTTAPADYDWFGTTEVKADVGKNMRGQVIRKVEIEDSRAEAQCSRYSSGLHMYADETEWAKLVQFKLVKVSP